MSAIATLAHPLPHVRPISPGANLLLFAIRRTGAQGLNDALAANAFLQSFGTEFRRPLTLLRVMMAESARCATGPVRIARPCCCRMTADEAMLIDIVTNATGDPRRAELLAIDLLGTRDAGPVLSAAAALSGAFEDLGLPLT